MKKSFYILFIILFFSSCAPAKTISTREPQTPTVFVPTEAPTAIPTPAPVEVAPGEFLSASQVVGYEARDTSGKLIYTKDIRGSWIKVGNEVSAPPADWAGLTTRLGSDFALSADKTTITGVEGLNINSAGEAIINVDGQGTEKYHLDNIKVQNINGKQTLLVAGYAWNGETKAWEVFNPGFAMEDPKTELGWFNQSDIADGNWLRWHQRALEVMATKTGFINPDGPANVENYMQSLFGDALVPTKWKFIEIKSDPKLKIDYNGDGRPDNLHYGSLWWENQQLTDAFNKGEGSFINRNQFPSRAGLTNAFLTDLDAGIVSIDLLNGMGDPTSLPTIVDRSIVWDHKKDYSYFAALAESSGVDLSKIEAVTGLIKNAKANFMYMIWPQLSIYPDQSVDITLSDKNKQILEDQASINMRTDTIHGNVIRPSASTLIWGAHITDDKAIQYWQWYVGN